MIGLGACNATQAAPEPVDRAAEGGRFVAAPDPSVLVTPRPATRDLDAGSAASESAPLASFDAGSVDASAPAPPASPVPLLADLLVEGGAGPMRPNFDPEVRRYSVIVTERYEALRLRARAASGLTLTLDGNALEPDAPLTIDPAPGTALAFSVENAAGERVSYSVVLLPPDFPTSS